MRYFIVILVLILSIGCSDRDKRSLNFPAKLFENKDTQNCIVSYFNFDCSSCIAAMSSVDVILKDYANVYYVVSSTDSIRTFYYLEKIGTRAAIIFDKDLDFMSNNRHIDFSRDYPIFVVKDGSVIYDQDPSKNLLAKMSLKSQIKSFLK